MAAQAPVAGALVLRAGFKDIVVGSFFRDATIKKGENLHESGHVFDVSERFATASSVLTAKCVHQACVTQEAYSIAIEASCHSFMLRILLVHAHYPCTCKMLRTFRIIHGHSPWKLRRVAGRRGYLLAASCHVDSQPPSILLEIVARSNDLIAASSSLIMIVSTSPLARLMPRA